MRNVDLGQNGQSISAVGLGCMGFTWAYAESSVAQPDAAAVLHHALDLGVTHLDTSDVYGPFTNEEFVGAALAGRRRRLVLATKAGLEVDPGAAGGRGLRRNGTPEHLRAACDASLKRLRTDVIDLYYLHRPDPEVPVTESWGALAELVTAGKVRQLGISEASVEQLEEIHPIHPVAAVQSELSLWTREHLPKVVPWCRAHETTFVAFSPLGRGYLAGGVTKDDTFGSHDFRSRLPRFTPEAMAANAALVHPVKRIATRLGTTPAAVALAWVLAQGDHVAVIPGTTRRDHVASNIKAAHLELSPEDLAELDALPEPVGNRY